MRFRTKLPVCHPTKFFIKGFLEAEESKTKNPGFRPKCRKSTFFRTFFEIFDFQNFQNFENIFFEKINFHFGKFPNFFLSPMPIRKFPQNPKITLRKPPDEFKDTKNRCKEYVLFHRKHRFCSTVTLRRIEPVGTSWTLVIRDFF